MSFRMNIDRKEKFHALLLALCPVLIVCTNFFNAVLMTLIFCSLLVLSSLSISLLRNHIAPEYSLLCLLLVNASWAGCLEMLSQALFYEITVSTGIYLPLLAMNSFILLALQNQVLLKDPLSSLSENIKWGLLGAAIICMTGLIRELLGKAVILENAEYVSTAVPTNIQLPYSGLEVLQMPAGVFLLLGLTYPVIRWLFNVIHAR